MAQKLSEVVAAVGAGRGLESVADGVPGGWVGRGGRSGIINAISRIIEVFVVLFSASSDLQPKASGDG